MDTEERDQSFEVSYLVGHPEVLKSLGWVHTRVDKPWYIYV
jgi:hypothetical protein